MERRIFSDGTTRIRKHHTQPRKLDQECSALRGWGPQLAAWVPRFLGADRGAGWLDLEDRPGQVPVEPLSPEAAFEAGRFSGALHRLEIEDSDPVSLERALSMRLDRFERDAVRHLRRPEVRDVVEAVRSALERERGARRRPCHRDFAPYNWLVCPAEDGSVGLTVLDFEHARMDWVLLDRARLDALVLFSNPAARAAFDRGYGAEPDRETRVALARWEAARTLVWGRMHDDELFVARGERMLRAVHDFASLAGAGGESGDPSGG